MSHWTFSSKVHRPDKMPNLALSIFVEQLNHYYELNASVMREISMAKLHLCFNNSSFHASKHVNNWKGRATLPAWYQIWNTIQLYLMQETFTHFMNYDLNSMHAEMRLDIKTLVFRAGCVAPVGKRLQKQVIINDLSYTI